MASDNDCETEKENNSGSIDSILKNDVQASRRRTADHRLRQAKARIFCALMLFLFL
jgi:hypothetical protein